MYEKYFSFKYKPFELIPNPDFLFLSKTHKKAATYLDYGIKEKIGFVLLTGEIGSGKTTIVRNLIKNLNGSIRLSRINNTKVSSEELISMINEDFGLPVEGKNKIRMLSELNEFLIEQYSGKSQSILLIDEAQNLSSDLLEEIRLLSNLETDRTKLLQIILVGQPELKKTLMLPELMQLRQRININYHLTPLAIEEIPEYIMHRITVAGNPDSFNIQEDMINYIYQFSRGIPRLINIVCDFALLTAYTEEKKGVDSDIVHEVLQDLESRDYLDDSQSDKASMPAWDNKNYDLVKAAGDMALRIIELEEKLKVSQGEFAAIVEKVKKLEEQVAEISETSDDSKINALQERISGLERVLSIISEETSGDYPDTDTENSLEAQVKLLKRMLSKVNTRLSDL
jgi:putative secretion ATPase (PEP-CTERM system associated)